jgi:DNA polymerase-1
LVSNLTQTSAGLYGAAGVERVERAIVQMEQNGFALDVEFCNTSAANAREDEAQVLRDLTRWLRDLSLDDIADRDEPLNWASPKQLVGLFHDRLGLAPSPVWKKGRVNLREGERKLDETALEYIRARADRSIRPGIDSLIRLRRIRGAIKYLSKLPNYVGPDGLVHPVSGPASDADSRAGTITWRLACKNPEVMQIPTDEKKDWYRVRRAFVAPPGHILIAADEKALEVVVLAHILIKLFDDHQLSEMVAPGAPDIHSVNARLVFGRYLDWERHGRPVADFALDCFKDPTYPELCRLRQAIKEVWYGLMYGKSAYGFATSLRDAHDDPIGEEAAGKIVAGIYEAVPGVPKYQAWVREYVLRHGGIPGLGGAWCDLSAYLTDKWGVERAVRIGQNYPMQEGGARIIGKAMADITEDRRLWDAGLRIERQVHDEFDFRLPLSADRAMVKRGIEHHMTSYGLLSCLQVSIGEGTNWDEC